MLSIFLYIAAGAIIALIFCQNGFTGYLSKLAGDHGFPVSPELLAVVSVLFFGIFWPIALIDPIRRAIQGKPFWDHEQ